MWPLELGGAGIQYASALDQGTATRNAQSQYMNNQNYLNNLQMGNAQQFQGAINQLGQGWENNLNNYIANSPQQAAWAQGMGQSQGDANGAVAQARAMGAQYGTDAYGKGNSENAALTASQGAINQDLLQKQVAERSLGAGQAAMQYGQGQAGIQFGAQQGQTLRDIQAQYNKQALLQALYGNLTQSNLNRGNQNMMSAAGVGRTGQEVGSLMQLGGLGYGAAQSMFSPKVNGQPIQGNGGFDQGYYSNSANGSGALPWYGQRLQGPAQQY